ncbi:MAG: hypothetical protein AMXMBFR7_14690 [Planctomycetota bacterium]
MAGAVCFKAGVEASGALASTVALPFEATTPTSNPAKVMLIKLNAATANFSPRSPRLAGAPATGAAGATAGSGVGVACGAGSGLAETDTFAAGAAASAFDSGGCFNAGLATGLAVGATAGRADACVVPVVLRGRTVAFVAVVRRSFGRGVGSWVIRRSLAGEPFNFPAQPPG